MWRTVILIICVNPRTFVCLMPVNKDKLSWRRDLARFGKIITVASMILFPWIRIIWTPLKLNVPIGPSKNQNLRLFSWTNLEIINPSLETVFHIRTTHVRNAFTTPSTWYRMSVKALQTSSVCLGFPDIHNASPSVYNNLKQCNIIIITSHTFVTLVAYFQTHIGVHQSMSSVQSNCYVHWLFLVRSCGSSSVFFFSFHLSY